MKDGRSEREGFVGPACSLLGRGRGQGNAPSHYSACFSSFTSFLLLPSVLLFRPDVIILFVSYCFFAFATSPFLVYPFFLFFVSISPSFLLASFHDSSFLFPSVVVYLPSFSIFLFYFPICSFFFLSSLSVSYSSPPFTLFLPPCFSFSSFMLTSFILIRFTVMNIPLSSIFQLFLVFPLLSPSSIMFTISNLQEHPQIFHVFMSSLLSSPVTLIIYVSLLFYLPLRVSLLLSFHLQSHSALTL